MGVHIQSVEVCLITDCPPSRDMIFDSSLFFELEWDVFFFSLSLILILLADDYLISVAVGL